MLLDVPQPETEHTGWRILKIDTGAAHVGCGSYYRVGRRRGWYWRVMGSFECLREEVGRGSCSVLSHGNMGRESSRPTNHRRPVLSMRSWCCCRNIRRPREQDASAAISSYGRVWFASRPGGPGGGSGTQHSRITTPLSWRWLPCVVAVSLPSSAKLRQASVCLCLPGGRRMTAVTDAAGMPIITPSPGTPHATRRI